MENTLEAPAASAENKAEHGPRMQLFHVSGFPGLARKEVGDRIMLVPVPQGAEGSGVYFSEKIPRFEAAEGAQKGVSAVVVIEADSPQGWWRSKGYVMRKFGRPRT